MRRTAWPRRRPRPVRPRRRRLRLVLAAIVAVVVAVPVGAALLLAVRYSQIHRVTIVHAPPTPVTGDAADGSAASDGDNAPPEAATSPGATNILLTGSDGRSCVDPSSPYADGFLANPVSGDRSDTIMVAHIDQTSGQLGMLSFPRDLLVTLAGTHRKDRINAAFTPADPNQLIQTIESNFGIRIDHYVGVDFCAFKSMVDALGGITIPFQYPARDDHTGLDVTSAGCEPMSGDEALAYVRSRYYAYQVNGHWVTDTTSDYGRIARQQDFVRRLVAKALDHGATNPITASHLLDVARSSDVVIDSGLSLGDMIDLGNAVKGLDPQSAASYRIGGTGTVVNGADVIIPDTTSSASRAVLDYFRGGPAPVSTAPSTTSTTSTAPTDTGLAADAPTPGATNDVGIFPPSTMSCPN